MSAVAEQFWREVLDPWQPVDRPRRPRPRRRAALRIRTPGRAAGPGPRPPSGRPR